MIVLRQSLNTLLADYISKSMAQRAEATSNLTQIAQIVTNLEHLQVACVELERALTNIRSDLLSQIARSTLMNIANI